MSIKPWICNGSRTIVRIVGSIFTPTTARCRTERRSPFYVNDVPDFVVVFCRHRGRGLRFYCASTAMEQRQILLELPAGCMEPTDVNPAAGAAKGNSSRRPAMPEVSRYFSAKVAPNAACISNFAHCYLIRGLQKSAASIWTPPRTRRSL